MLGSAGVAGGEMTALSERRGTMIAVIQEEDLPRLAELYAELSGEAPDLEAMTRTYQALQDDIRYLLRGVWSDGVLVGAAMGVVCAQLARDARPFMVLENFVVAERYRRKGLGVRLLREMERLAGMCNCRCVVFVSSNRRKSAHSFTRLPAIASTKFRDSRKSSKKVFFKAV